MFAACLVVLVLTLAPDISHKTTAELRRHSFLQLSLYVCSISMWMFWLLDHNEMGF